MTSLGAGEYALEAKPSPLSKAFGLGENGAVRFVPIPPLPPRRWSSALAPTDRKSGDNPSRFPEEGEKNLEPGRLCGVSGAVAPSEETPVEFIEA